ncbi:MAG: protein-L-isoaspartate(D-aspartate) O-methyltransferase [Flavobacteriales bacterium]
MKDTFRHQGMRMNLVSVLSEKGITDQKVLKAISKIPRHLFIDKAFVEFAYENTAFPIGCGQTISHPYTVAFQSQILEINPNEKVLEIGTGSGYQTAVLLELKANVFTIERHKELYEKTSDFLPSIGYQAMFFYGDGYKGLNSFAPFDKIIVTAGATEIPKKLLLQLKVGGKMVIPVGNKDEQKMKLIIRNSDNEFSTKTLGKFSFVPLLPNKT